jgi:hypothetical protein
MVPFFPSLAGVKFGQVIVQACLLMFLGGQKKCRFHRPIIGNDRLSNKSREQFSGDRISVQTPEIHFPKYVILRRNAFRSQPIKTFISIWNKFTGIFQFARHIRTKSLEIRKRPNDGFFCTLLGHARHDTLDQCSSFLLLQFSEQVWAGVDMFQGFPRVDFLVVTLPFHQVFSGHFFDIESGVNNVVDFVSGIRILFLGESFTCTGTGRNRSRRGHFFAKILNFLMSIEFSEL